jgi:protein-serine/threonine kinase
VGVGGGKTSPSATTALTSIPSRASPVRSKTTPHLSPPPMQQSHSTPGSGSGAGSRAGGIGFPKTPPSPNSSFLNLPPNPNSFSYSSSPGSGSGSGNLTSPRSGFRRTYSSNSIKVRQVEVGPSSFQKIKLLGKGDVGKVYLVREKKTDRLFAMKGEFSSVRFADLRFGGMIVDV